MPELFRKVYCSERMPDKDGLYTTNEGGANFYTRTGHFNIWDTPIYWYEPVEIPNDQEIENMAANKYPGIPNPDGDEDAHRFNLFQARQKDGFIQGFKVAINRLTGGNNYDRQRNTRRK